MQGASYIITVLSITGTIANALQKKWCFWLWLGTNTFWVVYDVIIGAYGQALLYVVNAVMCIVGLIKWQKN